MKWRGSPALREHLVSVTELHLHPENPRRGDLRVIADSLSTFGQLKPIVTWRDPEHGLVIVAGNHTYRAAVEELAWDQIAAVEASLSPLEARQYLVADNRASDLGDYYADQLSKILAGLKESGALTGTGWSPEQVDAYVSETDRLAEQALARARERRPPPDQASSHGPGLKEIHLLLPTSEEHPDFETTKMTYRRFQNYVKMLRKEYGTEGVTDTLAECVNRAVRVL